MTKNVAIKVNNLTKSYKLYAQPIDRLKESLNLFGKKYHKDFHAVKDLSFEVKKGETVGIIGRNGCGKSTLLKMITNVLTPSSGRVIVHGHISAILELGAGFNPEMTGLENIYLNTSINGFSKEQTDQKIEEILEFSELGEFIYQPIKIYSSGMKARLAFAVAINAEPNILIVDEALSVGDAAFQRKCFAKMEEIRANGATVLFVSHSEGSINSLCNRAIWLSNGEQVLDGVPKLVTGLYLKYSNAKQINKEKILVEYQGLVNKEESSEDQSDKKTKTSKLNSKSIEDFYDPELKSKSTIFYSERDAAISNVKIATPNGRQVNVLIEGKEYIYSYEVDFFNNCQNIKFSMLIKTKDGVGLGGGLYPNRSSSIPLLNGKVKVSFRFKCLLNNGEYFFNAGVQGIHQKRYIYLHRILDAYVVKVISNEKEFTSNVNFIQGIDIRDVS